MRGLLARLVMPAVFGLLVIPPADAVISSVSWTTRAAFPYVASRITGTAWEGFGYGTGGDNNGVCGDTGSGGTGFYRYDPVSNTWQQLQPPATCTTSADNLCAAGGFIFKPGGLDPTLLTPSSNLSIFTIDTGSWSVAQEMPTPLWRHAAVALEQAGDVLVFCIGGRDNDGLVSDAVYRYSLLDDEWIWCTAMPAGAREWLSATIARDENGDDKIIITGGKNQGGVILDAVEELDPADLSWRSLSPLPFPVHSHTCERTLDPEHPASDYVFVIGGEDDAAILTSLVLYETATDEWFSQSAYHFNYRRRTHGSFVIADDLYIFAGWDGNYLRILEKGETAIATPTPPPVPSTGAGSVTVLLILLSTTLAVARRR
ncbi:hypothetical protein JW905_10685 [bacterium]|nr:hypothetical protein [candidate division CSSED10-310 bacterium]